MSLKVPAPNAVYLQGYVPCDFPVGVRVRWPVAVPLFKWLRCSFAEVLTGCTWVTSKVVYFAFNGSADWNKHHPEKQEFSVIIYSEEKFYLKYLERIFIFNLLLVSEHLSFFLQGLDEEQSVQLLQCYLQEDYRGTRDSLKVLSSCLFPACCTSVHNTSDLLMNTIICNPTFWIGKDCSLHSLNLQWPSTTV